MGLGGGCGGWFKFIVGGGALLPHDRTQPPLPSPHPLPASLLLPAVSRPFRPSGIVVMNSRDLLDFACRHCIVIIVMGAVARIMLGLLIMIYPFTC